jgi:protein LTV1
MIQAVDEFIHEKKDWFKKLHREFGDEETRHLEFQMHPNHYVPREQDLLDGKDEETLKREIRDRMEELAERFEQEGEAYLKRMEAIENGEIEEESDEDKEEKWDCETILSTYTNTDNHPGVIKTQKRVRPNQRIKIELHKQFRVPVDGLTPMAEEIVVAKEKKNLKNAPFTKVEESSGEESDDGSAPTGEVDERKANKKRVKEEKREKRRLKKELKQAFKTQNLK